MAIAATSGITLISGNLLGIVTAIELCCTVRTYITFSLKPMAQVDSMALSWAA
jgi:hypothetical protein